MTEAIQHVYHGHKGGRHKQKCERVTAGLGHGHLAVIRFEDGLRLIVERSDVRPQPKEQKEK